MSSTLLRIHHQSNTLAHPAPAATFTLQKTSPSPLLFPVHNRRTRSATFCHPGSPHTHNCPSCYCSSIRSSLSPQSSAARPPTSREEAVLQAKTCLSTTLEKPLNNPRVVGKFRKLKQPKFRVEIPLLDDTPESLAELALEIFQDVPIKRKGPPVKILFLWPDAEVLRNSFESRTPAEFLHSDMSSLTVNDKDPLNFADVGVVLGPDPSQLEVLRAVTERMYPNPVVVFNPRWAYEDEESFGEMRNFVGSFEVIYSFVGLEVRGILSRRKGVIFKCVRDGVVTGERWAVHVEEEGGELKVVSSFKSRPSIGEVENVLYNLVAMNSPITKSAKFLRELVSNVTGKK